MVLWRQFYIERNLARYLRIHRGARCELDLFSSVPSTDAIFKRKIMKYLSWDNKDPVLVTYHCNFKNLDLNVSPGLKNKRTITNGASWHTPGWVGISAGASWHPSNNEVKRTNWRFRIRYTGMYLQAAWCSEDIISIVNWPRRY